jgi:serine-type D-Ala-D-Ala carboxypeptidase/endopeptidase (penicillin-binding protein 4)
MKKYLLLLVLISIVQIVKAQSSIEKCKATYKKMYKAAEMKYSLCSFVLVDFSTGKTVIDYNGNVGMPAASTQKLLTAITILDKLPNKQMNTNFIYDSAMNKLEVFGYGDPSLGSHRFSYTKPEIVMDSVIKIFGTNIPDKLKLSIAPSIVTTDINPTWTFEDIATYYGSAAHHFNWRENQFDITLKKGKNGTTEIASVQPTFLASYISFTNGIKVAGSTDETKVFFGEDKNGKLHYTLSGTIAENMLGKDIGIALSPDKYFAYELSARTQMDVKIVKNIFLADLDGPQISSTNVKSYHYKSITQDSMLRHFLRRSINLYGDALLINWRDSFVKNNSLIHQFAESIGIDKKSIHIFDACGLSPQNRITTNTLIGFLTYAKRNKALHTKLLDFLPTIEGIKMKSGSIHGVRAFAGYITDKQGKQYAFAINANNYSCSGAEMQKKLFQVLHALQD